MRDVLKSVLYVGLMVLVLAFVSCQKEKHVVIQDEDQQESLSASSSTVNLLARTTSNDGSWDNIIDGSSCFDINFPYTVWANEQEIEIESKEDLIHVEEIFDAIDTDEDLLTINFPITVVMGDYTAVILGSKEELIAAAKLCLEGGIDDDIECIDIVYPIAVFTFDSNIQILENYSFKNDFELRRFIASLKESDKISVRFPMTFKMNTGTEVVVNSLDEISNTITAAIDECDEDDDDDHNDDDYTKEGLDALLIECPWTISEFEKNAISQINHYKKYVLVFTNDNTVKAIDKVGNIFIGEWNTQMVNYDLLVEIHFDDLEDFNKQWFVYEIKEGKVKFYTEEQSKIVIVTDCQIVVPEKNQLRDVLLQCEWVVNSNKIVGQTLDKLQGYKFVFIEDQTIVMSGGQIVSEGTWDINLDEQGNTILSVDMYNEPSIHYDWTLTSLQDTYLTFSESDENNQLNLQRVCDDNNDDTNVVAVRNYMLGESWHIYGYVDNERDLTQDYEGDLYSFLANDKVSVELYQSADTNLGLWRVSRNKENKLVVYLNFDQTSERTELNAIWEVVEYTANHLLLSIHNEDGTTRTLTFQK